MVTTRMDLREKVPVNIVKGAGLENTMNDLFETFAAGEEKNAELVNNFFDQLYFRGKESLLNKLIEIKPDIKFDDMKDEGINLAILQYNSWMWDFRDCLNKITNNNIKKAFIEEIHNKVQTQLGTITAYSDFNNPDKCGITPGDTNVLLYFQKVVDYLNSKEGSGGAKKTLEVLYKINITNENLNTRLLAAGSGIPMGINLTDPSIPEDIKNAFDDLLSFEIGKEADRTINITKDISKKFQGLLTNTFPAINTIVGESDEYKYDEDKFGDEYKNRLQTINDDTTLSEKEKKKQIKNLKWEAYLNYLKSKNSKIGNALQQLYENDFDYDKIDRNILKDYIDAVANIRFKMLVDNGLIDALKVNFGNIDSFESFYKDLADINKSEIELKDVDTVGTVQIPIQKKIVEGKNQWLKDIDEFGKNAEKSYDALPIEYTINKADFDKEVLQKVTIEDKEKLLRFLSRFDLGDNYVIEGENIGNLIYLYFVINRNFPITSLDPEKQKEVENLFGQAKNSKHNSEENSDDESEEENNEGNNEYTSENFKEDIEKYGPGKFENGSEIWLPMGNSELPGGGYQWMKVKISNVNMSKGTFKGTVFGGELKFSSGLEGKSREFKMDNDTLENLKKISKDPNKIWLQPNPDKSDFNSFRESLGNRLGTSGLSFPTDGTTTWDGNKFMHKIIDENGKEKEVETKYFGASSDDKSVYKIEYNPIRKSFTVSSTFNGDEKGKDGKSEKKRFSYKRDMDWNNFLIFFTQKGLVPQTEEEANSAIARQDQEFKMVNGGKWKLNWFSFNNIKNVFKTIKGNIKKKIDEYNKSQDEKLEDILVGDWGIYNKLAGVLGFIPSMKGGLGELQREYYNSRDNKTWKKIEGYLKIFQSDPDFGTTFEQVPPFAKILGGKSYKDFIMDLAKPHASRSKDDVHKAAALLLANIEKGASPYRGLAGEENSGLWVRVLLGDDHYAQFMRDKQKCINDLKKDPKEKDQIQDVLATCEMDYIINNVSGANGKLKYFGSHEGRGIPGEKGTDYIDNPSKRLLSDKFASTLKGSYKGRFNKSAVEESFGKISHNDFNLAKEDFKRLLKSSRFPGAVANLKKMFLLAKTPEQQSEYQKCFLLYMLSGVLDVNGKKDLRKQTYQRAKTMGFLPGMLAKETSHSPKVATLLDDFCQEQGYGKFSDSVKSYFHEGDLKKGKLKIEDLIKELDSRWTVDKMKEFEKYSKSIFPSKKFPEGSMLKKLQKDTLDPAMENIDNSLLDNPLVANSGGLLSNANVVRDRMAIRDGAFDGKDPDERNNRALFWDRIANEVRDITPNDKEKVNFVLNQYFSWFGLNSEYDRQEAYEWIKTAYHWKDQVGHEVRYKYNGREDKKLTMGRISSEDIKDILRYTFKGKVMSSCFGSRRIPSELNAALEAFQDFFEEAFDNNLLKDNLVVSEAFKSGGINVTPMLLGSREVYKDVLSGGDNDFADDIGVGDDDFTNDKQRRKAQKKAFQTGGFINHKIAQIEKSLKKLPSGMYRPITQDVKHNIDGLVELL